MDGLWAFFLLQIGQWQLTRGVSPCWQPSEPSRNLRKFTRQMEQKIGRQQVPGPLFAALGLSLSGVIAYAWTVNGVSIMDVAKRRGHSGVVDFLLPLAEERARQAEAMLLSDAEKDGSVSGFRSKKRWCSVAVA